MTRPVPDVLSQRLSAISNAVFILVSLVILVVYLRKQFRNAEATAPEQATALVVEDPSRYAALGHRLGPPEAPLTIVEFADFECTACRAFALDGAQVLRATLGDSVAIVFRHWPLDYHRFAYPAARAAECASRQGKFVEYHDALFTHQDSLGLITFEQFAVRIGVPDTAAFNACNRESDPVPAIEADKRAAAELQLTGTPSLLINGELYVGALDGPTIVALARKALHSTVRP